MPKSKRRIDKSDIINVDAYAGERRARRAALLPAKKLRRVDVGAHCSFYFESYDSMLLQVQEMLYIEKGGAAQLVDELSAYNPLIPNGDELVATMMFEIDDPVKRLDLLLRLGGIENHVFLQIGSKKVYVVPEEDAERTSADGKTSSVHFFHFPLTGAQKDEFVKPGASVILGSDHPAYPYMTMLSLVVKMELARDFA